MASPNLIPVNLAPGGDTFQYLVQLTNNLTSWVNVGVYTNGTPTSNNANVIIIGTANASQYVAAGNNTMITFLNDNNTLTGRIYPKGANSSVCIQSSNVANKLELFANGTLTVADVRVATVNDINAISNTTSNAINIATATAYANSVAYTNSLLPAGIIMAWAANTAPAGWYECDGSARSNTTDAALFAIIGTTYGNGNGTTGSFSLPNLQGEFIRGWDHGRGVDTGRVFGSWQSDSLKSHTHTGTTVSSGDHTHTASASSVADHTHNVNDPGHAHTINDPGHNHGVYDPGHSHGVYDPGHAHSYSDRYYTGGTGNNGNAGLAVDRTTAADLGRSTSASGTGIGIYGSGTGIGIYGNGTGISINGSTTHITLGAAGGHTHTISLVNSGAHTHTFTTNATGDVETRPRNVALMYIIKR